MEILTTILISFLFFLPLLFFLTFRKHHNPLYLIDFSCYRPPDHCRVPLAAFHEHSSYYPLYNDESINFQVKMLRRSGLGPDTCMPDRIHQIPSDTSLSSEREEIEAVLFTVVEDLLTKAEVKPGEVDILVSNCSLSSPTPSIASMVINRFGFRTDIRSFNLSGMGCSAGLISVALARDLLKVHANRLALVLSMEAVSSNGYLGNQKSMLLTNCIFRMGGSAILLSNQDSVKGSAKYALKHLIRTHLGSHEPSYNCLHQMLDPNGYVGVSLSRDLIRIAGRALKTNIGTLGPRVLPISEQIRYGVSVIKSKIWKGREREVYVPDFRRCFKHFCIHAGGRAVIEKMEESLRLSREEVEASRMTLYRFGNTSAAAIWYELQYLEEKRKVRKGEVIWQIGLGSGFKCNSAVWECLREEGERKWKTAWTDTIETYPVDASDQILQTL